MEQLLKDWEYMAAMYSRQLELLENGKLRTHTNNVDTTLDTIMRVRACLANVVELIAQHQPGPSLNS